MWRSRRGGSRGPGRRPQLIEGGYRRAVATSMDARQRHAAGQARTIAHALLDAQIRRAGRSGSWSVTLPMEQGDGEPLTLLVRVEGGSIRVLQRSDAGHPAHLASAVGGSRGAAPPD